MSGELDDDAFRAMLDRISAERATMKPGEHPEEQPMPDAASPSPSEMDDLQARLRCFADITPDHPGGGSFLNTNAVALVRESETVIANLSAQVLRLTEENEALRKGKTDIALTALAADGQAQEAYEKLCAAEARINALEEDKARLQRRLDLHEAAISFVRRWAIEKYGNGTSAEERLSAIAHHPALKENAL